VAIAGAAFGAGKALEDIIGEQMLRAQMQAREQEAAARTELERARLSESMRQNDLDEKFRGRQEDRVLAGDRQKNNEREVRRMIGEGITRRVPIADMEGMAFAEGIDLTPKKVQYTYTDPKTGNKSIRFAQEDQIPAGGLDMGNEPQKPEKAPRPGTHVVGGNLVRDDGTVLFTAPDKTKPEASFGQEKSNSIVRKINDLIGDPNDPESKGRINSRTAGVMGSMIARLPVNSEARDVGAELESLAANLAFEQLQKMRDASKTGGALGNVSEKELALLQNAEASIRQDQSPENLIRQLGLIRDSAGRFDAAAAQYGGIGPMKPATSRDGAAPKSKFTIIRKQ